MSVFIIPFEKQKKIVKRFQKFSKELYIKVWQFSKDDLFFETNLKGYYTNFNTYKNNTKAFIETLKEVKDDFNFSEKDVKEIEKEIKKLHRELLDEILIESI